jgi:ubiquinone/menaquinone biosynthesis C-methylase UbiE
MQAAAKRSKGYKGMAMEGPIARWYARIRGTESQIADWKRQAAALTSDLPDGADVLEVAPGPGYFTIELARLGRFHVTALDISHTFVQIVAENARKAGVRVDVRQGSASSMPFADGSFDFIVCQAAFKNFSQPVEAIDEMYRVLRDGGTAVIEDMDGGASDASISDEVRRMKLGRLNAFVTARTLRDLRRRAYTPDQFRRMAAASKFGGCEISTGGIGMQVWLTKHARTA